MPEEISHGPSHVGVIAHAAALRHGREWLDRLLAGLDANRRLLGDLLTEYLPSVRYRQPQATYLGWLDCRALGLGQDRPRSSWSGDAWRSALAPASAPVVPVTSASTSRPRRSS
jgi:cysteine-S-conjugate beta-lyase